MPAHPHMGWFPEMPLQRKKKRSRGVGLVTDEAGSERLGATTVIPPSQPHGALPPRGPCSDLEREFQKCLGGIRMISRDSVQTLIGGTAYSSDGGKIGNIGTVYLDNS